MADVKWIKLTTDIFENRKIRQIECLPDGDSIIVIWVKLLCLAGSINDSGLLYITKEIPYTEQMLATQFGRPLATIQLAMKTFEQFGMLEVIDNVLHISNWEKYQNVDRLAELKEYNRNAQRKSRAKKKLLNDVNDMSMTCQPCQDIDKSRIEKIRKEEIRVDVVVDDEPSYNGNETEENVDKNVDNSFEYMGGQLGKGVVILTNAQRDALLEKLGIDAFNHYIDKLSTFILSKDAKVGNHYQTIRKWAEEDMKV